MNASFLARGVLRSEDDPSHPLQVLDVFKADEKSGDGYGGYGGDSGYMETPPSSAADLKSS